VLIGYRQAGRLHRVAGRQAVLACFHAMIPYLVPDLPAPQRAALARNVRTPLVYTNVILRNWHPWIALGAHSISAPMSFHCHVKLDFPVSLGGYRAPRNPSEPIAVHMVHVPGAPNRGLDAREQFRIGRQSLLGMTFADFEERIRDELDRMLGPGGFASGRDIAAITVNRWAHGYAYEYSALWDPEWPDGMRPCDIARKPFGRIAIANSDAGAYAYTDGAIDQAYRAVRELLASS
jgi:spermidine dehydrogenase